MNINNIQLIYTLLFDLFLSNKVIIYQSKIKNK
jgi:hypothetical protein